MDDKPFTVRIVARGYEVDSNGHVAGTVLLQYGQHARWECMRAAGIDQAGLAARGIGPVSLEERIRFHLVRDPAQVWRSVATAPQFLSLGSCARS